MENNQVNAISSINLWNKQLGHPSHEVLSFLPSDLGVTYDQNKDNVCKSCYHAKQTMIIFLFPIQPRVFLSLPGVTYGDLVESHLLVGVTTFFEL